MAYSPAMGQLEDRDTAVNFLFYHPRATFPKLCVPDLMWDYFGFLSSIQATRNATCYFAF